jgi:hypothetical protein
MKVQKEARRYKKRVRRHEDTNIEEGVFGLLAVARVALRAVVLFQKRCFCCTLLSKISLSCLKGAQV